MSSLRLFWLVHRFEALLALALLAGTACALVWINLRLDDLRPVTCISGWRDIEVETNRCIPLLEAWRQARPADMHAVAAGVVMFGALALSTPIVSLETEQRTTELAWAATPARLRWLMERVGPAAIVLTVGLAAVVLATEAHEVSLEPGIDARASFDNYGSRYIVLGARGAAVFSIGVAASVVMDRQWRSFLMASILSVLLIAAMGYAFPFGIAPDARAADQGLTGDEEVSARVLGGGWELPDGRLLTNREARAMSPFPDDDSASYDWLAERFRNVTLILSGERLGEVERRESAILLVLSAGTLLAAGVVVQRRRP